MFCTFSDKWPRPVKLCSKATWIPTTACQEGFDLTVAIIKASEFVFMPTEPLFGLKFPRNKTPGEKATTPSSQTSS